MKCYFGEFDSLESIKKEFSLSDAELEGVDIIYANYDCPPYEGHAQVIFHKNGLFYEVNGNHCSCYGLEGQWEPKETSLQALLKLATTSNDAKENLQQWV